jgi:hypothetical protein
MSIAINATIPDKHDVELNTITAPIAATSATTSATIPVPEPDSSRSTESAPRELNTDSKPVNEIEIVAEDPSVSENVHEVEETNAVNVNDNVKETNGANEIEMKGEMNGVAKGALERAVLRLMHRKSNQKNPNTNTNTQPRAPPSLSPSQKSKRNVSSDDEVVAKRASPPL